MRAIILAAGMGTRLRPITLTTPKSLIEIGEETLIERQIRFLKEKGIDDVIVVTGYLAEKFEFLREKYQVTLIHNDKYDVYNNFYTMFLVKEYLSDTYVIDADNYLVNNFLQTNLKHSTYFSAYKTNFKQEWVLHTDENQNVTDITIEVALLFRESHIGTQKMEYFCKLLFRNVSYQENTLLYIGIILF